MAAKQERLIITLKLKNIKFGHHNETGPLGNYQSQLSEFEQKQKAW